MVIILLKNYTMNLITANICEDMMQYLGVQFILYVSAILLQCEMMKWAAVGRSIKFYSYEDGMRYHQNSHDIGNVQLKQPEKFMTSLFRPDVVNRVDCIRMEFL